MRISRVRGPLVQISAKSANLQQNLCHKPRGSGEDEISEFSGFEGHLVQILAKSVNLQHNLCNKPRGSEEEGIYGFLGFGRHWSRFQRKAPICSKTCVINRVVLESVNCFDLQGSEATGSNSSEYAKWFDARQFP